MDPYGLKDYKSSRNVPKLGVYDGFKGFYHHRYAAINTDPRAKEPQGLNQELDRI